MKYTNRRDLCFTIGQRMQKLNAVEAAIAWNMVGRQMEHRLGHIDKGRIPKFLDVLGLIGAAVTIGKVQAKTRKPGEPILINHKRHFRNEH